MISEVVDEFESCARCGSIDLSFDYDLERWYCRECGLGNIEMSRSKDKSVLGSCPECNEPIKGNHKLPFGETEYKCPRCKTNTHFRGRDAND